MTTIQATTTTKAVVCENRNGAAWIILNRPENRNALSPVFVTEIYDHILSAGENDKVRCIVITGSGPAFCAGADLKGQPGAGANKLSHVVSFADVLTAILECPKPVIAAVNGVAFGGGLGLVGAADIVITDADAKFSFSEVRLGVIPAIISVVCLPKLGKHHAMKLFLTGERFNGQKAVEMGFAHRAVSNDELVDVVEEVVEMIKLGGPNAIMECKKLVRRVPQLSTETGFKETTDWSARMFQSEEAAEGMDAFRTKRKPRWVQVD